MSVTTGDSGGQFTAPDVDADRLYLTETEGGAPAAGAQPPNGGSSSGGSDGTTGPGFSIDTAAVRSIAGQIAQTGTTVAQILNTLRSQLASMGEPWGTDSLGQSFGHGYAPQVNQGFASMAPLGQALCSAANGLVVNADGHDQADADATGALNQVGASPGGSGGPGATAA